MRITNEPQFAAVNSNSDPRADRAQETLDEIASNTRASSSGGAPGYIWPLLLILLAVAVIGGLIGLTLTGVPALMATATQQYANGVFWFKMYILLFAVIFTFTVRRNLTQADEGRVSPVIAKLVALVSIVAWMAVAAGGRLIMYL